MSLTYTMPVRYRGSFARDASVFVCLPLLYMHNGIRLIGILFNRKIEVSRGASTIRSNVKSPKIIGFMLKLDIWEAETLISTGTVTEKRWAEGNRILWTGCVVL